MTDPVYYTTPQLTLVDDEENPLIGAAASGLVEDLEQIYHSTTTQHLSFLVQVGGEVLVNTVALTFSSGNVTIAGIPELTFSNTATGVISAAIIGYLGMSGAAAIGVATATDLLYSSITNYAFPWYEEWSGTQEVEFKLKDADGDLIGGAIYENGTDLETEVQAIRHLVEHSIDNAAFPNVTHGMTVEILVEGELAQTFGLYELSQAMADCFGESLQDFLDRGTNENLSYQDSQYRNWIIAAGTDVLTVPVEGLNDEAATTLKTCM